MSIPLDRLYTFIDQTSREIYGDPVLIYRFWPNGSKNINNLRALHPYNWAQMRCGPALWCNDQELLHYDYYSKHLHKLSLKRLRFYKRVMYGNPSRIRNLNYNMTIFNKGLLLHSEKRSYNLEKYIADGDLIPVYYWSHAVIARDWYRYAKFDNFKKNVSKLFLIYNRAWTGTREYRLRFTDLLIEYKLIDKCLTFCNPIDNGQHYSDHTFVNSTWRPQNVLEHYIQPSAADSLASGDFCSNDYCNTEIEVVLETIFDDDRIHLTEKSLRPIACGQPFILASTHGSLQYLRDYGFKTFDTVWDESYDDIRDPFERMQAIVAVMRKISTWNDQKRGKNFERLNEISRFNQNYFFSDEFQHVIISELKENLAQAFTQLKMNAQFTGWLDWHKKNINKPEIQKFLNNNKDTQGPTANGVRQVISFIKNFSKKSH